MVNYANYAACEGDVAKLFHFVLRAMGGHAPGSGQSEWLTLNFAGIVADPSAGWDRTVRLCSDLKVRWTGSSLGSLLVPDRPQCQKPSRVESHFDRALLFMGELFLCRLLDYELLDSFLSSSFSAYNFKWEEYSVRLRILVSWSHLDLSCTWFRVCLFFDSHTCICNAFPRCRRQTPPPEPPWPRGDAHNGDGLV